MGTTKSRKSRRNNSRPTAFTFLSNIALGSESEKPPDESIPKLSSYLSVPNVLHYVDEPPQVGGNFVVIFLYFILKLFSNSFFFTFFRQQFFS